MKGPSDADRLSDTVIAGSANANIVQSKPSRPQPSPAATNARALRVELLGRDVALAVRHCGRRLVVRSQLTYPEPGEVATERYGPSRSCPAKPKPHAPWS